MTDRRTDRVARLERARAAYDRREWSDAYALFAAADEATSLGAEDLERLAISAYLVGLDAAYFASLERAYEAYLPMSVERATRCAFWLGLGHLLAGKSVRANGWLARAQGHVESHPELHAEEGYLLIPRVEQLLAAGDWESAQATAERAVMIGERLEEPDLRACARHLQGRALLGAGHLERGFALIDEVMLDVTGGTVSPIMTGLVYCSVIGACQQIYALARAHEWTDALSEWCDAQPQMLAFSGTCLVHRAEILQLNGKWPEAISEARRACERHARAEQPPSGAALYRQAEIHRLRGEYGAAERAYLEANQSGCEPQPGLALLRLAQGNEDVACGSIRRVVAASDDPLERAGFLPAYVEIMLAAGDLDAAREACRDLADIARRYGTEALAAMAAQAEGTVALADSDAQRSLDLARKAFAAWQRLEAPYDAARARILAGAACQALDDDEGARLELDAARSALEALGAAPELARIDELCQEPRSRAGDPHGLTPRELEVLRHLTSGKTNKAIAAELCLSEKTIERHLSNIFNKLDVSSRTAAAAFAYEHGLL